MRLPLEKLVAISEYLQSGRSMVPGKATHGHHVLRDTANTSISSKQPSDSLPTREEKTGCFGTSTFEIPEPCHRKLLSPEGHVRSKLEFGEYHGAFQKRVIARGAVPHGRGTVSRRPWKLKSFQEGICIRIYIPERRMGFYKAKKACVCRGCN